MASTITIHVGAHQVVLSPEGTVQVDVVAVSRDDWKKLAEVVHSYHVRLGLAPETKRGGSRGFIRAAPLWIKLVTLGKVQQLPVGPSLRGIRGC